MKLHAAYYEFHALLIERTLNCETAALQHVGVDHCRFHILVSKQFLDSSYIIPILEKLSGEAMAEGVGSDRLIYFG